MKRRTLIRIVSFCVAILIAVFSYITVTSGELAKLRRSLTNNYSANLYEFDGSVSNISTALKKAVYSNGAAQFVRLATQLATESNTAMQSLSKLPNSFEAFEKIGRFLNQIGDYSVYLSNKLIQGGTISEEERENLNKLALTADKVAHTVEAIRIEYDAFGRWDDELWGRLNSVADIALDEGLGTIEELLLDSPTLIYDGPFSDSTVNGEVVMLKGKPTVSVDEARKRAADILRIDESTLTEWTELGGKMPSYCFYNGDLSVQITKQGGYVSFMKKHRQIGEYTVSYESAVDIAERYLKEASGQNFVSTYYFAEEGICTVNLAFKEGATVCYPDLIKVGVALDTGEVVSVEAFGFLSNHYRRTINTPRYTANEATEVVSDILEIKSTQRAIILTNAGTEKHCYEFLCKGINGDDVLVYINVATLQEEEILILLKTDGGTLSK